MIWEGILRQYMNVVRAALVFVSILLSFAAGARIFAQQSGSTEPARPKTISFSTKQIALPSTGNVSVIDPLHIWVGLALTQDGGHSWTARLPKKEDNTRWFDIPETFGRTFFKTENRGWLNGTNAIWATIDEGQTWSLAFPRKSFSTIGFSTETQGWMAVKERHRSVQNYVTSDAGVTWSVCGNPWPDHSWFPTGSVSFISPRTGWVAVGRYDDSQRTSFFGVAKTIDGGCNWKVSWQDTEGIGGQIGEVQFLDKNFGLLMPGNWGSLLKTDDGGVHWERVSGDYHMEGGFFTSRTDGWALGNPTGLETDSGLAHTSDGGKSWDAISASEIRANRGIARTIPTSWGAGYFRKLRITYDWP
jgi:photosystem II stability/assembly factor-like uncharacterized protein